MFEKVQKPQDNFLITIFVFLYFILFFFFYFIICSYGYHCSRISYYLYDGVEVLRKIFDPLRNFGGALNTVGIYFCLYTS